MSLWERKKRLWYWLGLLLTVYLVSNIGISRFMLGAHSID
jgi:membrane-associated phospholipid phosphatase